MTSTSTSILTPTLTTSWKGWVRAASVFFAVIVFAIAAFAVGRSTVHVHAVTPVVARPSVSVPLFSSSPIDGCRVGRPPC